MWSSVEGIAQTRCELRAFRGEHARVRTLPARELDYGGRPATLVRFEAVRSAAALDVVLERESLRVLAVR